MARRTARCARCGAHVVSHDEHDVEFRCPACAAVAITIDGAAPVPVGRRGDVRRRREIDLRRFTIDRHGEDLNVSWPWSRAAGAAVLVGVGVAGYLGLGLGEAIGREWETSGGDWAEVELPIVGLAALLAAGALGALHLAASALLNRTEMAIQGGAIHVWHGPIPTPYRSRRVPLDVLKELRVERKVHRSDDHDHVTYELWAIRTAGRRVRLIADEKEPGVPRAIKTLLDAHLAEIAGSPAAGSVVPGAVSEGDPEPAAEVVTLSCPRCGGTLAPPPERDAMRCRFCKAKIRVPAEVRRALSLRPARRFDRARFRKTFHARKEGDRMIFSAGWVRWLGRFVLLLSTAPLSLAAVVGGLLAWNGAAPLAYLFAAAPGLLGVQAAYVGLCYLCNRTVVTVEPDVIRVTHGPLPWRRSPPLPTAKIKQLVVREERVLRDQPGGPYFELQALSYHGAALTLFGEIPDQEALESLERLIERRLGLVDAAVRG